MTLSGNLTGLKASHKKALEKLLQRRSRPEELVGVELAKQLAQISHDIGRQVGVLMNRRGHVVEAFVGAAKRIYLPDIGRYRGGAGHLRGLRHVHTCLGEVALDRDDLVDLEKLRLDAVVSVGVTPQGEPAGLRYATLAPQSGGGVATHTEEARSVFELEVDFVEHISAIEEELGRVAESHRHRDGTTRAVVVGVYTHRREVSWRQQEIRELAATAGVEVADCMAQLRKEIDGRYVVGKGKLEAVTLRCVELSCELVILDQDLSPAQARAIAATTDLKVIDRTQLILDIFSQHAKSRDGKLQVELAQLKYNLPRLTDLDAGLSRLTGGIGGRGPGETKLEINRRRARDRISRLEREITALSRQRSLRRSRRQSGALPIVSIVGYTNAGKSTLLNSLTRADTLVADQLFATLDPASRRLRFPRAREAIITDTVGFIRSLPAELMNAFRATLEELDNADLLLHVVDVSDPMLSEKKEAVETILKQLELTAIPRLLVLNKVDRVDDLASAALARQHEGICISAATRVGLEELVRAIAARLWQNDLFLENPWIEEEGASGPS